MGQEKWQAAYSEGLASLAAHNVRVSPRTERPKRFTFYVLRFTRGRPCPLTELENVDRETVACYHYAIN